MVAQHGSALSPWQKSCVWSEYPTQPPATSSTSPTDSGSRIVLPHLSLKIPATTAYPAASVGHVRQRLRTPRTRTKSNKPVAKGESRAPTRPHPPHRSPHLSLSLPLLSPSLALAQVVVAQSAVAAPLSSDAS